MLTLTYTKTLPIVGKTQETKLMPRLDLNTQINQASTSTRFLTSTDYLSLSSLRLGYNIPAEEFGNSGISSVRLFLTGDNLLMLSKRKGYNPTTALTGGTVSLHIQPLVYHYIGCKH